MLKNTSNSIRHKAKRDTKDKYIVLSKFENASI